MRHLILLGALAGAAVFTSSPGAATDGPWCLMTRDIDCSQPSYEMCHFAGSPFGGYCYRNLRYRRPAWGRAVEVVNPYGGPPSSESWWGGPTRYEEFHAQRFRETAGWYRPAAHQRAYYDQEASAFWQGYQPVMLRMPPAVGTLDRWCLNIGNSVNCSIPTYEVCRFTALPETGYCFPNPYYRGVRRSTITAERHPYGRDGAMAMAARSAAPALKVAGHRPVSAHAGVEAASVSPQDGDNEIVARLKAIEGSYEAFAMVDDTSIATAPTSHEPTATDKAARQQPRIAALGSDGIGAALLAPVKTAPVPRKGPASMVPALNVTASCRAAANVMAGTARDVQNCLDSENSAREQLAQQWAEFLPAERASCLGVTTIGGGGTYTELLTCLDLRRFARNMHNDDPALHIAGR